MSAATGPLGKTSWGLSLFCCGEHFNLTGTTSFHYIQRRWNKVFLFCMNVSVGSFLSRSASFCLLVFRGSYQDWPYPKLWCLGAEWTSAPWFPWSSCRGWPWCCSVAGMSSCIPAALPPLTTKCTCCCSHRGDQARPSWARCSVSTLQFSTWWSPLGTCGPS